MPTVVFTATTTSMDWRRSMLTVTCKFARLKRLLPPREAVNASSPLTTPTLSQSLLAPRMLDGHCLRIKLVSQICTAPLLASLAW